MGDITGTAQRCADKMWPFTSWAEAQGWMAVSIKQFHNPDFKQPGYIPRPQEIGSILPWGKEKG